ncbi:MAG: hypothetical protein ABI835_15090 [Chloroflexota bacterium]
MLLLIVAFAACTSTPMEGASPAPVITQMLLITATPMPTLSPYPWTDENDVMSGLCFESVNDAAGRTFAILSDDDLQRFFDLADNSHLCRHPVERGSFNFSGSRLLIGLWSKAVGCAAHHEISDVRRDDVARTFIVTLRLVVEPGCDYELVRPFWIGLSDLPGYDLRLLVQDQAT